MALHLKGALEGAKLSVKTSPPAAGPLSKSYIVRPGRRREAASELRTGATRVWVPRLGSLLGPSRSLLGRLG
eukprot:596831-Pyramimonas_sp.AAC.1